MIFSHNSQAFYDDFAVLFAVPTSGQPTAIGMLQKHRAMSPSLGWLRCSGRNLWSSEMLSIIHRPPPLSVSRDQIHFFRSQKQMQVRQQVEPEASTEAESPTAAKALAIDGPVWNCSLTQVVSPSGEKLPVGRLRADVTWPTYSGDVCLFIPVIDRSGSMSGKPFTQVKEALLHMLNCTLHNRNVVRFWNCVSVIFVKHE